MPLPSLKTFTLQLLLLLQVGVCPQFDMLWGELTGLEHLGVAGHVKGLPFSEVSTHWGSKYNFPSATTASSEVSTHWGSKYNFPSATTASSSCGGLQPLVVWG
jgi:hypothetical protein